MRARTGGGEAAARFCRCAKCAPVPRTARLQFFGGATTARVYGLACGRRRTPPRCWAGQRPRYRAARMERRGQPPWKIGRALNGNVVVLSSEPQLPLHMHKGVVAAPVAHHALEQPQARCAHVQYTCCVCGGGGPPPMGWCLARVGA